MNSEYALAISYIEIYGSRSKDHGNAEDLRDQVGEEIQHDLWEELEWTDADENNSLLVLTKSMERCRIDSITSYHVPMDDYAWNNFYSQHKTNFFKDRHYLQNAFPVEFGPSLNTEPRTLVEIGCGVGNALLPLLEDENKSLHSMWHVYGLDLSSVAIDLLKNEERFRSAASEGRAHCFVANIVERVPDVCCSVADVSSLLFCLSAIDPDKQQQAVRNVASSVRPGGSIVLRDYGRFDESQLKLGCQRGKLLKDNFYVKHDATKCYFFTTQELRDLFENAGLEVIELQYVRRIYWNRGTNSSRRRVWVQGRFRKPFL